MSTESWKEEKEGRVEDIFKDIMDEKFPIWQKDINLKIQEAQ